MMEPRLKQKNSSTVDRWRRHGSEII